METGGDLRLETYNNDGEWLEMTEETLKEYFVDISSTK